LKHADRQDEHRPLAIECVDLTESQLVELENLRRGRLSGQTDNAESADDEQVIDHADGLTGMIARAPYTWF
jgi:hypothetical protein